MKLALKDAAKSVSLLTTVNNALQELYKMYHYSAKMREGLVGAGKTLGITALIPTNISGTRWIGHRKRAVDNYQKAGLLL